MKGLAQRQPLLVSAIVRFAARHHPLAEIVCEPAPGTLHRTTYGAVERRARQAMRALRRLGVLPGDRVATLARAGFRHLEIAYAAMGMGSVFHPLDPRLPDDDLAALLDQGDDCVLAVGPEFAALAAGIATRVRHCVRRVVVLSAEADLPMLALPAAMSLHCYETLLAAESPEEAWPAFSEHVPAALCMTAGAGGRHRGVARSHRDLVLHALTANQPDGLGLHAADRVALCAGMHQGCGWALPLVAPMAGAALLLPGWPADAEGLARLLAAERATCLIAPPAVAASLNAHLAHAAASGADAPALPCLRRAVLGESGAAAPVLQGLDAAAVQSQQGWGVAEAGALLTSTAPTAATAALPPTAAARHRASQGRALFGIELRLTDADGADLPWDGLACGELKLRGLSLSGRDRGEEVALDADGWLATGDIASIDPYGYVTLIDRASDLIRAGGSWISAAALESAALGHADVAEAACVAARHPKWTERPVLLCAPWPGRTLDLEAVRAWLRLKLPPWSQPDDVVALAALPRTGGGRIDRLALRRLYASHLESRHAAGA